MFAPDHLGELARQVPFELVDAVLDETGATPQRIRGRTSQVGITSCWHWAYSRCWAIGRCGHNWSPPWTVGRCLIRRPRRCGTPAAPEGLRLDPIMMRTALRPLTARPRVWRCSRPRRQASGWLAISAAVWLNLFNICLTPEIDSERRAAHASQ